MTRPDARSSRPGEALDQTGCTGLVGVLGGGQLGRMLALAGIPLGLRFRFWDPEATACAGDLGELIEAEFTAQSFDSSADGRSLVEFTPWLDVATSEFENVPAELLERIERRGSGAAAGERVLKVYPPASAFRICQDRLLEKECFNRVGLETPRYAAVSSSAEVRDAIHAHGKYAQELNHQGIGLPCVLKSRRMGYDGKGQAVIRELVEIDAAFASVAGHGRTQELILESFVSFLREVSQICVRSSSGATRFWPLVENVHVGGILRKSTAPAPDVAPAMSERARMIAGGLLDELGYVGVLAIELFVVGRGAEARLLGNEMAPRVHNSGHWTIEGSATSQFENHLRAILGWPLGETTMREGSACAAMLNVIGPPLPDVSVFPSQPWMHVHLYGKGARPGRKVGHVTITAPSRGELDSRVEQISRLLPKG